MLYKTLKDAVALDQNGLSRNHYVAGYPTPGKTEDVAVIFGHP